MRSRRSRGGLGQAQRASAKDSGRYSNHCSGSRAMKRLVQCERGVSGSRECQRVGSDGGAVAICANGSVETLGVVARTRPAGGAVCSEMRCGGADTHKDGQGGRGGRRTRLPGPWTGGWCLGGEGGWCRGERRGRSACLLAAGRGWRRASVVGRYMGAARGEGTINQSICAGPGATA